MVCVYVCALTCYMCTYTFKCTSLTCKYLYLSYVPCVCSICLHLQVNMPVHSVLKFFRQNISFQWLICHFSTASMHIHFTMLCWSLFFFFSYSIFWLQFSLPRLLPDPSHLPSSCPTITWSRDDYDLKQCYDNLIFALSSKLEWATNYFTNNSTFRLKIHHYLEPPMSLYLHHIPPSMPRVSDVSVCFHNVSPALHHVTLQETAT